MRVKKNKPVFKSYACSPPIDDSRGNVFPRAVLTIYTKICSTVQNSRGCSKSFLTICRNIHDKCEINVRKLAFPRHRVRYFKIFVCSTSFYSLPYLRTHSALFSKELLHFNSSTLHYQRVRCILRLDYYFEIPRKIRDRLYVFT